MPNQTYGDGVVKYRVRRQHKVHAGNSDQLVARMTFAGGMSTIMSHAGVSKALTALWKTATIGQGLTRKKMTALLGYESKAYDMYSGDRSGGGGDGDGDGGSNVSPWPETDEQVQQQKDAERKEIRVNIKRSGKGKRGKSAAKAAVAALINEKDNLRSSIHRDEFMAVYACMWRILVGAHLHLTALSNGASKSQQQRRRQQDNNQSTADLDLVIQGTENSLTPRDSDNVRPGKVPRQAPAQGLGELVWPPLRLLPARGQRRLRRFSHLCAPPAQGNLKRRLFQLPPRHGGTVDSAQVCRARCSVSPCDEHEHCSFFEIAL